MVQVSYPGVYIQEKSSGVRSISGVSTSIAAFLGRTSRGPIHQAVRCLGLADFSRTFGEPVPGSDLAASVRQFFTNGGTDCYVVRVADADTAQPAAITLESLDEVEVLRVSASMAGVWGNGIRMEVDYDTPNPGETFNLRIFREEGGSVVATESFANVSMNPASARFAPSFVTQSSSLVDLHTAAGVDLATGPAGFSEARRPLGTDAAGVQATLDGLINPGAGARRHSFEMSVDGSAWVTVSLADIDPVPGDIGDLEAALTSAANDALGGLVPPRQIAAEITAEADVGGEHFLRLTATTAGGDNASVRVRRAPANDISAALMLGADNGGVEMGRHAGFRPAPTGTILRIDDGAGGLGPLNALAGTASTDLTGVTIGAEAQVSFDLDTTGTGEPVHVDAAPGDSAHDHNDGVREKLRLVAAAISAAPGSRYRAEVHGYQLVILARAGTLNEQPSAVGFAGGDAATADAMVERNTRQYGLGETSTSRFVPQPTREPGLDGDPPGFADYVGVEAEKTGMHALDDVDLFNLMVIPADEGLDETTHSQLQGPASVYCAARRAFLIIDAPPSWTDTQGRAAVVQNTADVSALRSLVTKDHSAVYYPRVLVRENGSVRPVGPGGTIAGLMARTDASRGVWKAPAGTEADLRGIVGLEARLTDRENGVLNPLGVNCLRAFPSGFVSWGARTLDGSDDIGSEWKYVPIRRLALFIEESLYRGTQWVVFEPNDEPLWANIRLNVGAFMEGLFRQGAFQGSTPDQAYFVKCDAETTTQADRNLGIVNIEVGFAPLKPAEFVVLTIQQIAGDL